MKRLIFLTEHLSFGGAEVVLTEYLRSIDPRNNEVHLIVRDNLGSRNYLLERVPSHVKIYFVFSEEDMRRYPKKMSHRAFRGKLAERVRAYLDGFGAYDAVIDFSPVLDKVISRFRKEPLILWIHGDKTHMGFMERIKYLTRIRRYKKIVVLCDEMLKQFESLFPSLKNKLVVIPNPVDSNRIKELSLQDFSSDVRLPENYSVSVGRLVPGKDFSTVVKAAHLLKNKGLTFCHVIIGDGELRGQLEDEIRCFGLEGSVLLLGALENPFPIVRGAQFFVHAAFREGLPTVIIEAMGLGLPVIATACPTGPKDILEYGRSGMLYDIQDYAKLAELMAMLYASQIEREKLSSLSVERASYFDPSNVIPSLDKLVKGL